MEKVRGPRRQDGFNAKSKFNEQVAHKANMGC